MMESLNKKPLTTNPELRDLREQNDALNAQLESAKLEIEKANSSKRAFLTNMSHEIRTPMTAILGFAEMLKEPELTSLARQDALVRIDESSKTLLKIIEDILYLSKADGSSPDVEKKRFSPFEVINEVSNYHRFQAEQKGLKFNLRFDEFVPALICTDAARLRQILNHLMGNAVKFTNDGLISINISTEKDSDLKQFLVVEIKDTGIGISSHVQEKLFNPFFQADESITRQFGGTGLGLALSKRLSQQLGGDLFLAESTQDRGSTFVIKIEAGPFQYLKREEPISTSETPVKHKFLQNAHVLIVDDVVDNQFLIRHYLETAGASVDVANNGLEAISKALNQKYDIVLMDMQMPTMDGIQATKRLRLGGYDRPIVALTAHAMREEVQRSIDAGCDEHLTKPISKNGLLDAVKKYIYPEQSVRH